MLSGNFKKTIDAEILGITIKVYYDYNKAKNDSDSNQNYFT